MSTKSEEKLKEWAEWYDYHKRYCSDVGKRTEFLEKALDMAMWCITHQAEDIARLEGRPGNTFQKVRLPGK